jgi:thioredoxin 1
MEVPMGKAVELKDADFATEITESSMPVLVDFWATWCGPCQMMTPIIEGLAEEYEGRVKVMKCNVDANPVTPAKFGIRGIPTLLLFSNGEVVDRITGAVPKTAVENSLKKVLG